VQQVLLILYIFHGQAKAVRK